MAEIELSSKAPGLQMLRRLTKHAVVRNALSLYGIQAAGYVLPILTFPYLARVLGPEKFGVIAWSQAFVGYFQVLTEYGFNFTVTREVSVNRDDLPLLCRIYTSAMAARTLLMLMSLAIMTPIIFAVPKMRAEWPLFYITFLTVVGSVLFPQWLFQGLERMEYITFREVGARFIGLMTIFFLVRTQADYLWAAAIMSGSTAIAALVGLLYVKKLTGVEFTRTSPTEIWRTFTDGWHIFLSTAAITLYTRSNTFILGLIAPEAEVGVYSGVLKLIDALKALISPLSTAIFPHISRVASESKEAAVDFVKRYTFRLTAPFAVISLGLLIGAPIAVGKIYGPGFEESIKLMRIMSPVPLIVAWGTVYSVYYMLGLGFKKEWSRLIISAGGFNFVVLVPLLFVCKASTAVAITGVLVEGFVLVRAYWFYRRKQKG